MTWKYNKSCGCSFPIDTEKILNFFPTIEIGMEKLNKANIVPPIKLDVENIPMNCPSVWDILGRGLTKGVFQLESQLGRQWTKRLRPTSIDHLAALGSILRPGCLHSKLEDGKSLTEHYCMRKNGEEEVARYNKYTDDVLSKSYNILIYQEQAMELARVIAGFSLQDADVLRKAIGKKLAEEMAKVKIMFINGVEKTGLVSKEVGEVVFGWIEKSQRYSFNKSHAVSYGINGYNSAYIKAHFPVEFFTAWLRGAHDKQKPMEEIAQLINEAKLMDISVLTPDIRVLEKTFSTDGQVIRFGIMDVKGIGEAQANKLIKTISEAEEKFKKQIDDWTWQEFLFNISDNITENVLSRLIGVGALSFFDVKFKSENNV